MVRLHDRTPVELVPQNAVVEVGWIFHHVSGEILAGHHAVIINIAFLGDPLPHDPVKVGDDHVARSAFHCAYQRTGGIRCDPVIAVQELKIGALGPVQRQVPARGDAGILFVKDLNAAVLGCICITDGAGIVRASVIDQQQFKIAVFLIQNTVYTAADGALCVIDRDDDTDGGTHKHTPFGEIFLLF